MWENLGTLCLQLPLHASCGWSRCQREETAVVKTLIIWLVCNFLWVVFPPQPVMWRSGVSEWMPSTPALSLRKGMLFPDQTQWIPDPCVFVCVCEAFDSPVTLEQTKACFHSLVSGRVRMHVYAFHGRCITIASFICQIETNYEIQWSEHFRIESDVVCFDSVDEPDDFWSPCESSWMYMFVQKCLAQKILEYR